MALIWIWMKWMHYSNISMNKENSIESRRRSAEKCQDLQRVRKMAIEKIDKEFDLILTSKNLT
jgi:hypothetical protein